MIGRQSDGEEWLAAFSTWFIPLYVSFYGGVGAMFWYPHLYVRSFDGTLLLNWLYVHSSFLVFRLVTAQSCTVRPLV